METQILENGDIRSLATIAGTWRHKNMSMIWYRVFRDYTQ